MSRWQAFIRTETPNSPGKRLKRFLEPISSQVHFSSDRSDNGLFQALSLLQDSEYLLYLEERAITYLSSEQLQEIIQKSIEFRSTYSWDIFYLYKILDRCEVYFHPDNLSLKLKNRAHLVRTLSPNGTLALFISKNGIETLLRTRSFTNSRIRPLIEQGALKAITITPNAFHLDQKVQREWFANLECSVGLIHPREESKPEPLDLTPLSWFIVVTIIIVIAVLLGYYYWRLDQSKKRKPYQGVSTSPT